MNTNSILSSVNTTKQTSNSFFKTSNVDKTKSDDFENFMASQKSSTQTNTNKKTEIIKEKDLTQKLYDDIIFLLTTNISNEELKLIKERLAQIKKMKEDGKSDDEIQAALKQLAKEIEEIRKNRISVVVEKTDDNTKPTNEISDLNKVVTNIKDMFQEIQESLKNKNRKIQMQISSTNSSIYSAVSSSQTTNNTQNTNSSFNTLVNNSNQETTTTSSTNKVYKKINDFLDAHNGYSSLSPTDEKIFREILSDNKLTKEEADTLSYEQVERISKLLTLSNLTTEEFNNSPVVLRGVDLTATTKTGNRQFNEAYYNTKKELPTNEQKHILEKEVGNNLAQLYSGKELRPTFTEPSYLPNAWEYQNMNTDFRKFIKDVINHHNSMIANPNVASGCKEQLKDVLDVYDILEKNYNQVLSKTKYA